MHRVLESHLNSFAKSNGFESEKQSEQFEKFVNFSIISSKVSTNYDIEDVTTSEGDDGTDGIAIIIDEEVIVSKEDAAKIFATDKRNHDVDVVCIQAKTSESVDLGDFLKFKESVLRFVNGGDYNVPDETQRAAREVFDVVIDSVPKVKNGRPSIVIRYVTAGIYQEPAALEVAKREFESQLSALGLFNTIDIKFVDRDELIALWVSTYSGISARLEMFSIAPMPSISGIEEAYLGVVKAKEFVAKILTSSDGTLRTHVFEENVRSFLGSDNPINHSIAQTINSGDIATRFPVLNNGITIVSPNVVSQNNTLYIENFQIVNGCQTSNVLFDNRDTLTDSTMVTLKVVETSNEDVFSELVRATNSQSKIEETQFFSLKPVVRAVELYFNTFDNESRLYFERRDRQYIGEEIPALRIFSVHSAAKCVCAMFCQRPDISFKYPKAMYDELGRVIFADGNKESVFYASCLSYYRFNLFVSSNAISQNKRRYKWHVLPLVRAIICGKDLPLLNSRAAETAATKLIDVMSHRDQALEAFSKAIAIIDSFGEITDDRLKRQAILSEMLAKVS
jgi:hypothetical protein